MKTLSTALLILVMSITISMTTTVNASEKEHEQKNMSSSESHEGNMDMQKMHEHMKLMQVQMKAIRSETDLEMRKQLMKGHRQSIREGMKMMMQDEDNKGMMGMKKKEIHASMKHEGKMDPQARAENMEEHLDMMQQMMEQMMHHQNEAYELYEEYRDLGTNLGS